MATKIKKKTVSFYEIMDENGRSFPQPLPWEKVLARLAQQPVTQREHELWDVAHWGKTYTYLDRDHFVLARSRVEGVPSLDVNADEIIDNETDVQKPWVEISVASFVPDTNIFGFVLGSQASPRPASIAAWLNAHKIFDKFITVGPVVSKDILAKLNGAAQAKLVRVKLTRDQIRATRQSNGLFSAARGITEEHGDVEVELIVRVSGRVKRDHDEERIQILETARGLLSTDFKFAVAELINFNDKGKPEYEPVNLLENRLAKKMDVSVTDDEGNPIRIQSAVTAILRAIDALGDELR
ncbi:hypothetical protein SAMN05421833_11779 [Microbispora rosea]|uniref:Uncharacterized protein n=1 Tax=Microbispora rosea TaxID=58117 RepID=A0A1N7EBW0_9ACTN|nr:hypothetical protein [Microbispora rosea]GIH47420.1 hypothetical protein Mro03_25990 [Microbispora rosea subsp. rosea]SIR85536.1 hypothetical protein SAMN05421833_11779 [Microbispora rosea]